MQNNKITKHVPLEELKLLIRKEKNKHIFERLLFIRQLYLGDSVAHACERMCIAEQTGYNWLDAWNAKGYQGLAPEFGGGRPSKLTEGQRKQLMQKLKSKANWLTSEIRSLIISEFGVVYSSRQVIRILRGFSMHYAKPYPSDYRRPDNAESLLREAIEEAVKGSPKDTIIGFIDETSPQTTDNRQRFWSFGKPRMDRNTSKYRANTFGFYPVNGKEVVEFMENSKTPSVCAFLRKVRDKNPGKHIIALLDNFQSHISKTTQRMAELLNIKLIFLPVYSPDLNPIEPIWKSVRRKISQLSFIRSEWSFRETIRTTFHRLAKKKSFMTAWLDKFQPSFSNLLCH